MGPSLGSALWGFGVSAPTTKLAEKSAAESGELAVLKELAARGDEQTPRTPKADNIDKIIIKLTERRLQLSFNLSFALSNTGFVENTFTAAGSAD